MIRAVNATKINNTVNVSRMFHVSWKRYLGEDRSTLGT